MLDNRVNCVSNEVLSILDSFHLLQVCNVNQGERKKLKKLLLLGILALISLGVISVATSTASGVATVATSLVVVILVIWVALVATLIVVLGAISSLELVESWEAHETRNNLLDLSVLFALSLLLFFFLRDPHFNVNRLGGSKEVLVVKSLDSFLCICYSIIEDVGIL